MPKTIFEKIISGEFEGSFIYKDEICVALMDLNPLNDGQTSSSPTAKLPGKRFHTFTSTSSRVLPETELKFHSENHIDGPIEKTSITLPQLLRTVANNRSHRAFGRPK